MTEMYDPELTLYISHEGSDYRIKSTARPNVVMIERQNPWQTQIEVRLPFPVRNDRYWSYISILPYIQKYESELYKLNNPPSAPTNVNAYAQPNGQLPPKRSTESTAKHLQHCVNAIPLLARDQCKVTKLLSKGYEISDCSGVVVAQPQNYKVALMWLTELMQTGKKNMAMLRWR